MKKLIMFVMVLMLCLGFAGEAKAVPDCVTICPAGAGADDEITLTVYDEEGEFVDLSQITGGVEIEFWEPEGYFYIEAGDPEMVDGSLVIVLGEALYDAIYCGMSVDGVYFNLGYDKEGPGTFESLSDAIDAGGTCPEEIPVCREVPGPFVIDPNVMLVYETGETEGDFGVSMTNALATGKTATVTVDPNQAAEDITLLGGDPCEGGTITLTFNDSNWDVPQIIAFKAIDDEIAEPPELLESQKILLTSVYSETLQDPNWAGEKVVKVNVMDNDQANIMFRVTPSRGGARVPVIGPVQLWEQGTAGDLLKWRKIGIQLQVQPSGGPVKLNAVVEEAEDAPGGDNLPPTDPCLPLEEADDPNCFTFTSTTSSNGLGTGCPDHDVANRTTCWNVDLDVKIWGNDDDVLQVEAFAEGDEDYQAVLSVTVIDDGGDERYADLAEDDPKTVQFDIEDNECGAFGISYLDVANSSGEDEPDCYVDIYDIIEFATRWLNCSDPQDPGCESYL